MKIKNQPTMTLWFTATASLPNKIKLGRQWDKDWGIAHTKYGISSWLYILGNRTWCWNRGSAYSCRF